MGLLHIVDRVQPGGAETYAIRHFCGCFGLGPNLDAAHRDRRRFCDVPEPWRSVLGLMEEDECAECVLREPFAEEVTVLVHADTIEILCCRVQRRLSRV